MIHLWFNVSLLTVTLNFYFILQAKRGAILSKTQWSLHLKAWRKQVHCSGYFQKTSEIKKLLKDNRYNRKIRKLIHSKWVRHNKINEMKMKNNILKWCSIFTWSNATRLRTLLKLILHRSICRLLRCFLHNSIVIALLTYSLTNLSTL